ncbi:MAG: hypothetical protein ACNA8K_17210 [Cyclonatronaceae bacterium]
MTQHSNAILVGALLAAFVLVSCDNPLMTEQINSPEQHVQTLNIQSTDDGPAVCGTTEFYTLYAGQSIDAGKLAVSNDGNNLYVTFTTTGKWLLGATHLHVSDVLNDIPSTKQGNPIPGRFAYSENYDPFVNSYTYTLSLEDNGWEAGNELFVAAHAVVVTTDAAGNVTGNESAWSTGNRFVQKGNWATYSGYTVQECTEVPGDYATWKNETAYGGNNSGEGSAWWFYYDASVNGSQAIYAGQKLVEGASVKYENGLITITLGDNLKLQDVNESVKIQGYNVLPDSRPSSGQFTTYKGGNLVVAVDPYSYFVIHLDASVRS